MTPHPRELRPSGRGSFRLSLRIARRDAAAHLGRSILIVALIAIPIVGLAGMSTLLASTTATPQESLRMKHGSNEASLTVVSAPDPKLQQDPVDPTVYSNTSDGTGFQTDASDAEPTVSPSAYLPAGTRILSLRDLSVTASTATGTGSLTAVEGQPWAKSFAGLFRVLSGHAPTNSHEIMATPAALIRLGAQVGSTVTVTQPRTGTFTIVGTLRDLSFPSSSQQLFAEPAALDGVTPSQDLQDTVFYLPATPLSWSQVHKLNHDGIVVMSRAVYANPPASTFTNSDRSAATVIQQYSLVIPVLVFSLFEVALLAGAAFTVGTQQQQRSLATLASVGGDRRMLARVVSSAGIVLGLVGGVLGSAVGILVAWIYMAATSDGSISQYPGFHINFIELALLVVFAICAGWIASLVPARRASRLDVVGALRGSLRPSRPSKRTPIIGVIIGLAGVAITIIGAVLLTTIAGAVGDTSTLQEVIVALLILGPLLTQVAALFVTPLLLRGVSRLLARAGTAARLAGRDTSRNAARSVPAIGAIMATIFIASFVITYIAAAQAEQTADYQYVTAAGIVSAGAQSDGLGTRVTPAEAKQLAAQMNGILHVNNTHVLYASPTPIQTTDAIPAGYYAVPQLNPAVRCSEVVPGADGSTRGSVSITSPDCGGPSYLVAPQNNVHIFVGSTAGIETALGERLTAASKAELAAGGAVSFYPEYVRGGTVTIGWLSGKDYINAGPGVKPARSASLAAVVQKPAHPLDLDMVISPETAKSLGIHAVPSVLVAKTSHNVTDAQRDALESAESATFKTQYSTGVYYEGGPPIFAGQFQLALLALCALITIGAASVAIGLSRAEGRRDEAVLGSLGAAPRLRRSYAAWGAALITGVGSIGGVILGTIPALAVSGSLVQEGGHLAVPFTVPWLPLTIAALGLPLALALGGWLTAGRSRIRYLERAPIE